MNKKKGYALVITIIITFFLTVLTVTTFTIVYRNTSIINKRKEELTDKVYDNGVINDANYIIYF